MTNAAHLADDGAPFAFRHSAKDGRLTQRGRVPDVRAGWRGSFTGARRTGGKILAADLPFQHPPGGIAETFHALHGQFPVRFLLTEGRELFVQPRESMTSEE